MAQTLLGKLKHFQDYAEGTSARTGTAWMRKSFVVEDVNHPGEGVVLSTFRKSIIDSFTESDLGANVEVSYVSRLRMFTSREGHTKYLQENEITHIRLLGCTQGASRTQALQQPGDSFAPLGPYGACPPTDGSASLPDPFALNPDPFDPLPQEGTDGLSF